MGHWGTEIFNNDIADEVKDGYIGKLKTGTGKSDEQILSEFLTENEDYITDDNDMIDFWFALSSIMHDYGRLTDEVKQKALDIIEKGLDLERWKESKKCKERLRKVEKLKTKLLSPLPQYRKVAILKSWICPWKENDVFLYKLDETIYNKISKSYLYVLLAVKDIVEVNWTIYPIYDKNPRTYLKLTNIIPNNLDSINSAIFLPRRFYRGDGTYGIYDAKGKWGFLRLWPKQRFNSTQKLFSFVGNFPGYTPPENEWADENYSKQVAGGLDLLNREIINDVNFFILKS